MRKQILTVARRTAPITTPPPEFLVGPSPKGPKRCLKCSQLFKAGERWIRYTSPPDPVYGAYAFGEHEACPGERKTTV